MRLWPLGVIGLLLAGGIGTACALGVWGDEIQSGVPWTIAYVILAVSLLALVVWLIAFSRLGSRPKWIILGMGGALVSAVAVAFEVGFSGNLTPSFWFRFRATRLTIEAPTEAGLRETTPNDVPEFLGPNRRPVFPNVKLDTDWKEKPPRELWRRPIGSGFGSFAVVGDYAVTMQQDGPEELVACYEWKTGRPCWKHAEAASFKSSYGGDGPRSTPTIDGGLVYSMGATGILTCLEGRDGTVVWRADTLQQNRARNLDWGVSCSPLVVGDLVVVSAGVRDPKIETRDVPHYALIAYNKLTGQPVWRAGTDDASYCSPALATLGGVRQIVIANAGTITGHDLADGHVLWEFEQQREWPTVSQVVPLDDRRVFVSKGYGAGCAVWNITRDANGEWSKQKLWSDVQRMRTKFTNVVIVGGQAYGLNDSFLECIDLDSGRERWTVRKGRKFDTGHGQIILAGDVLLVQTEQGDVALVAARPDKFEKLAQFAPLTGRTWNYPVLVGNYLLTRNDREAVCYELPVK